MRTNIISIKTPKFRPWAEALDNDIRNLISFGIDNKLNDNDYFSIPQAKKAEKAVDEIILPQISTIFCTYFVGMFLALVAFFVEMCGRSSKSGDK